MSIKHTRTRLASQHSYISSQSRGKIYSAVACSCSTVIHSFTKSTYTKNTVPGSALLISVKTTAAAKIEAWHIICVSHTLCVCLFFALCNIFHEWATEQNESKQQNKEEKEQKLTTSTTDFRCSFTADTRDISFYSVASH